LVSYDCIDSVGVDMQPQLNANPAYGLYFLIFVVVCSWFCTNLFIGAIADTFMELRKKEGAGVSVLLTDEQKKFVDVQLAMMKRQPSNRLFFSPLVGCFLKKKIFRTVQLRDSRYYLSRIRIPLRH
jgi:hypothetical protein